MRSSPSPPPSPQSATGICNDRDRSCPRGRRRRVHRRERPARQVALPTTCSVHARLQRPRHVVPAVGTGGRVQVQRRVHADKLSHELWLVRAQVRRRAHRLWSLAKGGRVRNQPGLHVRRARHSPAGCPPYTHACSYRNLHCPLSCGVCRGACKDLHDDCPGWAKKGECATNPGFNQTCPFSCVCGEGDVCANTTTSCAIWAVNDECTKSPEYMHRDCPVSCDVCSIVCEDKAPTAPTGLPTASARRT